VRNRAHPLGPALALQTVASDGDLGRDASDAAIRQRRLTGSAWTTVHQVHGARVVVVDGPNGRLDIESDGIVTAATDTPIAVLGADCSLIALASPEGVIGVAHAGWRGLAAGVISSVAAEMRLLGATSLEAAVGPMIHPECYPFGAEDLDRVAVVLGDRIRSTSTTGELALDLPGGVARALADIGATTSVTLGRCTACEGGWYSFRARRDRARHALVVWRPA
jgi:YfiH family protein